MIGENEIPNDTRPEEKRPLILEIAVMIYFIIGGLLFISGSYMFIISANHGYISILEFNDINSWLVLAGTLFIASGILLLSKKRIFLIPYLVCTSLIILCCVLFIIVAASLCSGSCGIEVLGTIYVVMPIFLLFNIYCAISFDRYTKNINQN